MNALQDERSKGGRERPPALFGRMIMTEVWMYNIEGAKAIKIKNLCRKLYIAFREVPREDFGVKISALLGMSDDRQAKPGSDFEEEMLFLSDFQGAMLDIFLTQLRRQKAGVALKAVRTESNVEFTSYELYKEISAERKALSQRQNLTE